MSNFKLHTALNSDQFASQTTLFPIVKEDHCTQNENNFFILLLSFILFWFMSFFEKKSRLSIKLNAALHSHIFFIRLHFKTHPFWHFVWKIFERSKLNSSNKQMFIVKKKILFAVELLEITSFGSSFTTENVFVAFLT